MIEYKVVGKAWYTKAEYILNSMFIQDWENQNVWGKSPPADTMRKIAEKEWEELE